MNLRVILVAAVAVPVLVSCAHSEPEAAWIVGFCQVDVRESLRNGNATFPLEFAFTVRAGRATDLRVTQNSVNLDPGEGRSCIGRWQLGFIPDGTDVTAKFQWRHGVGWESLEVAWPGHKLSVPVVGTPPYYDR